MSGRSENWFDRLAAPHTRRQGIKAAAAGVAGVAAASLPFARPPKAEAAPNPNDCRQGCVYYANQHYANNQRADIAGYALLTIQADYFLPPGLSALYSLALNPGLRKNTDASRAVHRQELNSCFQPFCPGFDPRKAGGPCESCQPPYFCNPCALVETGYVCCVYEQGDCHGDCCNPNPGGC